MKKTLFIVLCVIANNSFAHKDFTELAVHKVADVCRMGYNKPAKAIAATVGSTFVMWGLWSLKDHLAVVSSGFKSMKASVEKWAESHPNLQTAAKYSAAPIALATGGALLHYATKK